MDRKNIKRKAHMGFMKQYGSAVLCNFLYTLLIGISEATGIGGIIITPILWVSKARYDLKVYNGEQGKAEDLFSSFKGVEAGRSIGGYWYMVLWIWLWSFLFVIPGIVKAVAYSLTPYILADEPDILVTEALERSKQLTKGHKWQIFIFYLSFFGWTLLSCCTCGIVGVLYSAPYMNFSFAGIYEELRSENPSGLSEQRATAAKTPTIDGSFK